MKMNFHVLIEYFKTNFGKIIKTIWLILLLCICSLYIKANYNRMITGMIYLDYIVVLLSTVLVLMPLVSEMDLWGFKVKREMQRVEKELNREIINFQRQMLNVQNNNTQNINIDYLPSKKELEGNGNLVSSNEKKEEKEKLLFFLEVRNQIDYEMRRIIRPLDNRDYLMTGLKVLEQYKLINRTEANIIILMRNICNRAIHGEIISDDYYDLVKNNSSNIIKKLNEIKLPDEFWIS